MGAWLLASPTRWRQVKVMAGGGLLAVFVALSMLRCGGAAPAAIPPEPTGTSTALHAPTTAPLTASPAPTYGPADPIALEAVQAFLVHDLQAFTNLATPEAARLAAEAPRPGPNGVVTGPVTVIHDGPTLQDLSIPTTFGVLLITMGVHDDAWLVEDMAYQQ